VGHRFWWEFHYPEQGVTTANELWLPVDQPVTLRLAASDVIHSFWVPMLGGKRDTNPVVAVREGQDPKYNYLYFTPNEMGMYMGQCAEFCGESHAFMSMRVHVVEQDDFDRWSNRWHTSAGRGAGRERGRVSFRSKTLRCPRPRHLPQSGHLRGVPCHPRDGGAGPNRAGPDPVRNAPFAGRRYHGKQRREPAAWIIDPVRFKPGRQHARNRLCHGLPLYCRYPFAWPATNLDETQVRAVSAYLLSLQ
jgi:cytochrome c1